MQLSRWKKLILWSIGSLILGALGSGLWELALKPGGQWIAKAILTVATLGSISLKDGVYRQAAKGLHEEAALDVLVYFSLWTVGIFAAIYAVGLLKIKDDLKKLEDLKVRFDKLTEPDVEHEKENKAEVFDASLGLELQNSRDKTRGFMRKMLYISIISVALNAGAQFVDVLEMTESNSAVTFFRQSMAICRPYINDQESQMLESRFAAINGRDDYLAVIEELTNIAASHQRKLPNFIPW